MKDREYHLKIHSISRFIISMIVILLSAVLLIIDNLPRPENEFISIIQFIAVLISSFYLAHLIGMGKAKVIFTKEGLVHIWQKRFVFSREKNFTIPWDIVDNYVFQEDRTFDSFMINLTNNTRYKISRLNVIPIKDDFEKLVKDFPKLSNEYKNGLISENPMNSIKEGESIYASKSFRRVFYFLMVGFLVLLLSKVFNPEFVTTWSSLGVIGSGILFYGLMIKAKKKNN